MGKDTLLLIAEGSFVFDIKVLIMQRSLTKKFRNLLGTFISTSLARGKAQKKIGDYCLALNLDNKHEINYVKDKWHVDAMLAKLFMRENFKVLDLGANIGFCALEYIKYGASRVDAYEPQIDLYERLSSIDAFELRAFNVAVSDENAERLLHISESHNQGHTLEVEQVKLFPNVFLEDPSTEQVRTRRLDDIYDSSEVFDFIKMDIEGHELQALRGARGLLKRSDTAILQIEIYDKYRLETISELEKTFRHIYLVCYSERKGKVYLTKNFEEPPLKGFRNDPPNYICSHWSLGRLVI